MAKKIKFRSSSWFGGISKNTFLHRGWMKSQGYPEDLFDGRPVIGICNTYSELTPCNSHLKTIAEKVKFGVYEAGGFPLEFPVMSLGESNLRPTAMLYRNLVSMDVEESIRGNPIDGVVLLVGCDKTTPATMMGAASCDLPTLVVSGGPMLSGNFKGKPIGSATDLWKFDEDIRIGQMSKEDYYMAEACMNRSSGHCMTMGTASTLANMVEALGMGLPNNAAIPATDARRYALAQEAGRRIVDMVKQDVRMSRILTRDAFENAVKVNGAVGGSTNAVIHLIALAKRMEVEFALDDWDRWGKDIPTIVDLMPSGKFLMEDFYYAGGLPVVVRALGESDLINKNAETVNGKTIWENCKQAANYNQDVIRPLDKPLVRNGGIAVLRGNLAPDGAVIKPSAASIRLMKHTGKAVVFKNIEDYNAKINDPGLDIDESCIMVLKNCGPKGYPGMAEVGNLGLPPKILKKGIRDMVRISDARISGTAFGTIIVHVSPEAAVGGTLAIVKNGDIIELDVNKRQLNLKVSANELKMRRKQWKTPQMDFKGGYQKLYIEHVNQADQGCDFDFLVGKRGAAVPRHSH